MPKPASRFAYPFLALFSLSLLAVACSGDDSSSTLLAILASISPPRTAPVLVQ